MPVETTLPETSDSLKQQLSLVADTCKTCGLCVKQCQFLSEHGTPGEIASSYGANEDFSPFQCSLCTLCSTVCPFGVEPATMFLEMRREITRENETLPSTYNIIRNYERRGSSPRFSYYGLPEGCNTIFFPGCTLPGARPENVIKLFHHLQQNITGLGIVLDCCTKPSHDLGDYTLFGTMFDDLRNYLLDHGVTRVIVACTNCYSVFKNYGDDLTVTSAYEELDGNFTSLPLQGLPPVTVHDPCAVRSDQSVHEAVRSLVAGSGLIIEEMAHSRETTLCCGEGASVGFLRSELADKWAGKRKKEAAGRTTITYCAGCENRLSPLTPTHHLLDLLFAPEATLAGKAKISRAPFTYLNRLKLKNYFRKNLDTAYRRQRPGSLQKKEKISGRLQQVGLLAMLACVVLPGTLITMVKGSPSPVLIGGIAAMALLSALPFLYKKFRQRA